jgi:tellurite methyltransferase
MKFDDFYASKEDYFSQGHSEGMADCLKSYQVVPCDAIDIGAGEGRNSLYLASIGYRVVAVEPSVVGADKIRAKSKQFEIDITIENDDFLNVSQKYNNIGFALALTSLEHMEYDNLRETISEIKRLLAPGGYIYVMVFTEDDPSFNKDTANSSECASFIKHYFKKEELRSYFHDFDILLYKEYIKEDTRHGPVHYHGKAKIFARKRL